MKSIAITKPHNDGSPRGLVVGSFFLLTIGILITAGVGTYYDAISLVQSQTWLRYHIALSLGADSMRLQVANARLEQANFVFTGDRLALKYADRFLADTRYMVERYRPMPGAVEPEIPAAFAKISAVAEKHIGDRQRAVHEALKAGVPAAQAQLRTALLADNDDEVHQQLALFRHDTGLQILKRAGEFEQQIQRTVSNLALIVVIIAGMVLLFVAQKYVAARKRAEEAVFYREQRIRAMVDNMLDGLVAVDSNGIVQAANAAATSLLAPQGEKLIGMQVDALLPDVKAKNSGLSEGTAFRASGTEFPVEMAVAAVPAGTKNISQMVTVRDITERMIAEKWRRDFVRTMSDHLSEPLSHIQKSLSAVSSADTEAALSKQLKQVFAIAERNSVRLMDLINDLSAMDKAESGTLQIVPAPCTMDGIIERSMESVRAFADQHGVSINVTIADDLPDVLAEPRRIVQVLVNLLSNAAKFSTKGSVIDLSACVENDNVQVSVRDHGRGIPADAIPSLFERYKQTETADAKKGTGLGLPICKSIVEQHGGAVKVDSVVGQGTTFSFTLPIARVSTQNLRSLLRPRSSTSRDL